MTHSLPISPSYHRSVFFGVILVLALLGGSGVCQTSATPGAKRQAWEGEEMQRVTVNLSTISGMQTAMAFRYTNPPPWPRGNQLSLISKTNAVSGLPPGDWSLVNMHAENYYQIIRRRQLKTLEFGLLSGHKCFVVDSRVPREWMLAAPSALALEQRLLIRTRFSNYFRKNPAADTLVGSEWVLIGREDPGGLTERVLPGEKLRFGVTNLICETSSGTERGKRLWEVAESNVSLQVYDVQSAQDYTGATFELTRSGDELVLVPKLRLTRSVGDLRGERYDSPAKATYRREPH